MGRGWNRFEMNTENSLYYCEQSVKANFGEGSKEISCRKSLRLLKDYLRSYAKNAHGNIDSKSNSDEIWDGIKNMVLKTGLEAILL